MNQTSFSLCADDSFGPTVGNPSCRGGFDFTLLFEDSIFSIAPSALFLLVAPVRVIQLYKKNDKIRWPSLQAVKMVWLISFNVLTLKVLQTEQL